MKLYKTLLIGLGCYCMVASAEGQGTFLNLDFESANVSGYPPSSGGVPISAALPGWSAYFGSNQTTVVSYDAISIGGAVISIVDRNVSIPSFGPIKGNYSAYLFGGGDLVLSSATISQTAFVPNGTQSLLMDAKVSGASFVVTLGGQEISMVPLQVFPNYTTYGGDISAFSGQLETLNFTIPPASGVQPSMFKLDDIIFSDQAIPEPGLFGLSGLGVLLLGWRVLARRLCLRSA
jgi:hypothetical protein